MAKFKLSVSEPKTGKASTSELEGPKAKPLLGRGIGETVEGSTIGISGKKVMITGASDKDGIPNRADVHGGGKKQLILTRGVGFKAKNAQRERKLVRGRMITEETYQVNLTIIEPESSKKSSDSQKLNKGKN
jgi:small subunit ribosomal protein S6e